MFTVICVNTILCVCVRVCKCVEGDQNELQENKTKGISMYLSEMKKRKTEIKREREIDREREGEK